MPSLDRRDFIQGTALAATLAAVATTITTARPAQAAGGLLYVIAEINAKAGKEADVRAILTNIAERSRSNDAGCKLYTLLEVEKQPGRFLTFEIWTDHAALEGHMVSPQVKEALPKLGDGKADTSIMSKPFTQLFLDSVSVV
jgi:quinol monooxygenase YgiN